MNPAWLVIGLIGIITAAYVQAQTGFGFALIAAPALLVQFDARVAVSVLLVLHLVQCVLVLAGSWRAIPWPQIRPLIAGALLGTPVGSSLLLVGDSRALQVTVGAVLVVLGLRLLRAQSRARTTGPLRALVAGFASGVLNGGTGLSGPPVALHLSGQGMPSDQLRLGLHATFFWSTLAALAILVAAGEAVMSAAEPVAVLAPAVFVGVFMGRAAEQRLSALAVSSSNRSIAVLAVIGGIASIGRVVAGALV